MHLQEWFPLEVQVAIGVIRVDSEFAGIRDASLLGGRSCVPEHDGAGWGGGHDSAGWGGGHDGAGWGGGHDSAGWGGEHDVAGWGGGHNGTLPEITRPTSLQPTHQ